MLWGSLFKSTVHRIRVSILGMEAGNQEYWICIMEALLAISLEVDILYLYGAKIVSALLLSLVRIAVVLNVCNYSLADILIPKIVHCRSTITRLKPSIVGSLLMLASLRGFATISLTTSFIRGHIDKICISLYQMVECMLKEDEVKGRKAPPALLIDLTSLYDWWSQ
ncbi:MAG: hypothetical protein QXJ56_00560 [Ignisphaera sp.]